MPDAVMPLWLSTRHLHLGRPGTRPARSEPLGPRSVYGLSRLPLPGRGLPLASHPYDYDSAMLAYVSHKIGVRGVSAIHSRADRHYEVSRWAGSFRGVAHCAYSSRTTPPGA
jgi:hypothetical protein